MDYDLIVSQGRLADRSPHALLGARLAGERFARRYGLRTRKLGTPYPNSADGWSHALGQSRETLTALQNAVSLSLESGRKPLMIANSCVASLASLPVVARKRPAAKILWFDAHGDFNTPEITRSGYLGGMVLAGACGLWKTESGGGISPRNLLIVGARDLDPAEAELLTQAGVTVLPPRSATPEAVAQWAGGGPLWVHIDWDVLEPGHIPAPYKVNQGLAPDRLKAILEAIPANRVEGLELAEFEAPDDPEAREAALRLMIKLTEPLLDPQTARTAPAAG
ncbi:arginase family protein [Neomegalonema perideroedes]|uniref:arginase family protein n=1 Tax=Neomegalonema perideroedes TaxID=217219 RepID=UPI00036B03FC|nr:arginase family protein [Neomegalonema perideroedes]